MTDRNPLFTHNQFYIQFKAPNADELTDYVLNKAEDYVKFDWAKGCQVNTIDCPWQENQDLITPSANKFGEMLQGTFSYSFSSPWINCYERGSYQEVHDHIESDFASVFFPEVGDDFGRFYFRDRFNNSLTQKWRNLFDIGCEWYPDISPGDVIFFPGNVLHGVTVHKSEKTRKTLSVNYTFT